MSRRPKQVNRAKNHQQSLNKKNQQKYVISFTKKGEKGVGLLMNPRFQHFKFHQWAWCQRKIGITCIFATIQTCMQCEKVTLKFLPPTHWPAYYCMLGVVPWADRCHCGYDKQHHIFTCRITAEINYYPLKR